MARKAEINVALFVTHRDKFKGMLFNPEQCFIILTLLSENMLDAVDLYVLSFFGPDLFNSNAPTITAIVKHFEDKGWIKSTTTGIEMRSKWLTIIGKSQKIETQIKEWILEYCELFPDNGTKLVGYSIRMSTESCLKKMTKFVRTYKFSKEVILKVTKDYVMEKRKSRYAYIQNSLNFIEHPSNGSSMLATLCEEYLRKAAIPDTRSTNLPGQDVY